MMFLKKDRLICALLAGVMLVAAACSNNAPVSNQSSAAQNAAPANTQTTAAAKPGAAATTAAAAGKADPYDSLPMEISILTLDRGQVAASEGSYEDNRWVKWINENSPVKVKIVPVPRTESVAKTTALFAAGQAPDLVWEFGKGFMDNLYGQGVIQPLGDYIDKYSTSYKQYLKDHPELMPFLMENDGKQYGMTSARSILNIPNHALWIRQDWLDKFGMSTPQTMDELVAFMTKCRDADPSGKGTFGMAFNYNMPGILKALYGEPFGDFVVDANGKVSDWTASPGYQDYLDFQQMLYTQKLIDPEYISDTKFTRERELWVTGRAGVYLAGWDMPTEWRELKTNVPDANMQPLEPVSTKYGKFGCFQEPPANKMICMNKDAKNPKAIMAYMDWMITSGWFPLIYGIEGQNFTYVDGKIPKVIDPDKNKLELDYANEYAIVDQNQPSADWFIKQAADDPLSQKYAPIRTLSNQLQLKNKFVRNVPFTPTSDAIQTFNSDTSKEIQTIETEVFTGAKTAAQGFKEISDFKTQNGWDTINQEKQKWYDDNKALLK